MIGRRFGRLVVVSQEPSRHGARWLCLCDCGGQVIRKGTNLRAVEAKGCVAGCGCTLREAQSLNGKMNRTHGRATGVDRKLYDVWRQMHRRCYSQACKDYPAWGGRGITICDEWFDVSAFCTWAWSAGYKRGLTIERADNNGNYCPENCRWIPNEKQASNTRRLRFVTAFGKTRRLDEWAEESRIGYRTLLARLNSGWTAERAISEPPRLGKNQFSRP